MINLRYNFNILSFFIIFINSFLNSYSFLIKHCTALK